MDDPARLRLAFFLTLALFGAALRSEAQELTRGTAGTALRAAASPPASRAGDWGRGGGQVRRPQREHVDPEILSQCDAFLVRVAVRDPHRADELAQHEDLLWRMLGWYVHGVDEDLARAVVAEHEFPVLRRLLMEPGFPRRDNVVLFLGRGGHAEDVQALRLFLELPPDPVGVRSERRARLLVPELLGRLAAVGHSDGVDALVELLDSGRLPPAIEGVVPELGEGRSWRLYLESLMFGLAVSNDPWALSVLEAHAAGQGESGTVASRAAAELGLRRLPPAVDAVVRMDPAPQSASDASDTGWRSNGTRELTPGELPPSRGQLPVSHVDCPSSGCDEETGVRVWPLSFANHVDLPAGAGYTEAEIDAALVKASTALAGKNFMYDIPCCVRLERFGDLQTFGCTGDGLVCPETSDEFDCLCADPTAWVKIVDTIAACADDPDTACATESGPLGCAKYDKPCFMLIDTLGANGLARLINHELGHNLGLQHEEDYEPPIHPDTGWGPDWVMHDSVIGPNNGLIQCECNAFKCYTGPGFPEVWEGTCGDADGDDYKDHVDNCPDDSNVNPVGGEDCDSDGSSNETGEREGDQCDTDGDTVGDACDNCPVTPNPDQANAGPAGEAPPVGDACSDPSSTEDDDDEDGVPNGFDNCPFEPNPANTEATDCNSDGDTMDSGEGVGEQCDQDSDGAGDACDNCPATANFQTDIDQDGVGDACDICPSDYNPMQGFDGDADSDGVLNACDNCPDDFNPANTEATDCNSDGDVTDFGEGVGEQCDQDSDGVGDACDVCVTASDEEQVDQDSDGVGDVCDNCIDVANTAQDNADGDCMGDACDPCDGNSGVNNCVSDFDGDGVGDPCDNCLVHPNPGQEDPDSDGIGSACDNCPDVSNPFQDDSGDADQSCNGPAQGDGVGDACDNCPEDCNADQDDTDGDTVGDACDNCPGVENAGQGDCNGDGEGDACDADPGEQDADSDGECDGLDPCPMDDPDDPDSDGVCESDDNCPGTANPGQEDCNGDGEGDACDPDAGEQDGDGDGACDGVDPCPSDNPDDPDSDGVCESDDNCPGMANPGQEDCNGDGEGDACDPDAGEQDGDGDGACDGVDPCPSDNPDDPDSDGVCESDDNCPGTANPGQEDCNGDGEGDACDPDAGEQDGDGDGACDGVDPCPLDNPDDPDSDGICQSDDNCPGTANPGQEDCNGDAEGDACDPDAGEQDGDGDGACDGVDPCPLDNPDDPDSDGVCESDDNCPGARNPGQEDCNGDGEGDACDPDAGEQDGDGDGACDGVDPCPSDNPDDPDSDGVCQSVDNCPDVPNSGQEDVDSDGLGDVCDPCPHSADPDCTVECAEFATLLASDGQANDGFGVAASTHGDRTLVGASSAGLAGAAYVHVSPAWSEEAILTASDEPEEDRFGISVSLDGDRALVGADTPAGPFGSPDSPGAAYVFLLDRGTWTEEAKLVGGTVPDGHEFGFSVSLSGDRAAVGAPGRLVTGAGNGSVTVFSRSTGAWLEEDAISAADGSSGDRFGGAVALDGDTVVIGADGHDAGGSGSGSAYVFIRDTSGDWVLQQQLFASDARAGASFGSSVAIQGDLAVVGARNWADPAALAVVSGAAYVFERDGSGAWTQQARLNQTPAVHGAAFGASVGVDSEAVVVGAPGPFTTQGTVHLFVSDGTAWTEQPLLQAGGGLPGDLFGASVSIVSERVVVGASGNDANGTDAGAAYVFECPMP